MEQKVQYSVNKSYLHAINILYAGNILIFDIQRSGGYFLKKTKSQLPYESCH